MRIGFPRFFVDTNILVYPYDERDPAKRDRATEVLSRLHSAGTGSISTQVLWELYSVMTRRRALNLTPEVAEASVQRYIRSWTVYEVKPQHILDAMRVVREHGLSFYDSIIWATAKLNGIPHILSEDGQDGRYLEGVQILNPLAPDFDLDLLA
jgi:predicted nucleic acid-binding protein